MFFDSNQLVVAVLATFLAAALGALLVFERSRPRRRFRLWVTRALGAVAIVALVSWSNFGALHTVVVDTPGATPGAPGRPKIREFLPFHFHEFFHYYVGSKYFRELGYVGLYDCTALADAELAEEDGVPPKIAGYVRDLGDVLTDKTRQEALDHCRASLRPRFSDTRWRAFKDDQRALRSLVPDAWWQEATFDAGFNPPPSWVVVGSALSNAIPIRAGGQPSFLIATSLDLALLVACYALLRRAFGAATAATATIFFGATFLASYGWNGGAFLRYTWLAAIVGALAATKRERWLLAGALYATATCDRLFPVAFFFGAAIPIALRAVRSVEARLALRRLTVGFGLGVLVFVTVSAATYGFGTWRTFFVRIVAHGDIYYPMHVGLKKVVTFRSWVASQNFFGHDGLARFRDWNFRLRALWSASSASRLALQTTALAMAVWASARRKPYEASILLGPTVMFFFNLPANYYYVVLALVPALLLRAAATAPSPTRRLREYFAFCAFCAFWICTLLASRMSGDPIVYDHFICQALMAFLFAWSAAWVERPSRLLARLHRSSAPTATPRSDLSSVERG